jgi:hypothetical protein
MAIQTAVMFERVPAKLSAFNGRKHVVYDVYLELMVRDIWRKDGGLVAIEIAKLSLMAGSAVPDGGPYTLRYNYQGKPYEHAAMRVQDGKLII